MLKRFRRKESGQGMVEYGLILFLISVVVIGTLYNLGVGVSHRFGEVNDEFAINETISEEVVTADDINDFIKLGYIPIANRGDLDAIKDGEMHHTFAEGTEWEIHSRGEHGGLNHGSIYIQVNDIDMGEEPFSPIGDSNQNFHGTYNGGNYKIHNLKIESTGNRVGFFGITQRSVIENTHVVNGDVSGDGFNVGGLIGASLGGEIKNVSYTGKVTSKDSNTGGLVGYITQSAKGHLSTITQAHADVEVISEGAAVGGLVGNSEGGTIRNSYTLGNVNSATRFEVGGLVGQASKGETKQGSRIQNSYAKVNVISANRGGGLVGYLTEGSLVERSYATGNVEGDWNIGGLVGRNEGGHIKRSFAEGNVKGDAYVGGLVGYNRDGGSISDSFATGSAESTRSDGGVGGLVGKMKGNATINNTYATGTVKGDIDIGGIVGGITDNNTAADVRNSYFNSDIIDTNDSEAGEGKTTEEMKDKVTYVGWNFRTIWEMENGKLPTLK